MKDFLIDDCFSYYDTMPAIRTAIHDCVRFGPRVCDPSLNLTPICLRNHYVFRFLQPAPETLSDQHGPEVPLELGEKHKEALAVLKYGILDNKGFLLLTGDVGTGKTTLLNALIDSLGEDVLVALVTDPGLAKMDFFNFVADSFAMDKNFKSKGEFLIYLKNFLLDVHRQNKQTLLIIDECQHLNQKLLEEVRLLSNIEKSNTKLINIFFVGQSEFNNIILRPA